MYVHLMIICFPLLDSDVLLMHKHGSCALLACDCHLQLSFRDSSTCTIILS